MIEIGKLANRETICILTNMNEPLGYAVGNNLEVIEAIEFLRGNLPEDLKEVVLELGSYMIKLAGLGDSIEENKQKMLENIKNGKALKKLEEMIENQGGKIEYIEDTNKFEKANYKKEIKATKNGYIQDINAEDIGKLACYLGAGRIKKEDSIDNSVGIILNKKVSEKVDIGNVLAYVHCNDEEKLQYAERKLKDIIKISEKEVKKENSVIKIMR